MALRKNVEALLQSFHVEVQEILGTHAQAELNFIEPGKHDDANAFAGKDQSEIEPQYRGSW